MGASNQSSEGKKFFKLKPVKTGENKGELRFFEQTKTNGVWGDGEMFTTLSGTVTNVCVKTFEWEGETVKNLVVDLRDDSGVYEFSLGMSSTTAKNILNTLAGDNGFDLVFVCGKVKNTYPQLYINKLGNFTNEESRTNWKYPPDKCPKVTVTEDEDGNKIYKGRKAADEFWAKVLTDVSGRILIPSTTDFEKPQAPQVKSNHTDIPESDDIALPDDDLPF